METYATVTPIPPVPSLELLTYRVPAALRLALTPGARVLVPLGRRRITGLVIALGDTAPPDLACRDVGAVVDDEPVVNEQLLDLLRWMANYYAAPLSEVVSLVVGRGLSAASRRFARLIDASVARSAGERKLVAALEAAGGVLDSTRLSRACGGKSAHAMLTALAARGAIVLDDRLVAPTTRAVHEVWLEIAAEPDEMSRESILGRAPKRREIYEHIAAQPGRGMTLRQLAEIFATPGPQVSALVDAGLVRKTEREVYRDLALKAEGSPPERLSIDQDRAVAAIDGELGKYAAFLLHGVTASGKTEVYASVIARVLARDASALVLVPEISLTHQLVARLIGRFGQTVAVLHSELSPGERWDQWRRIRRGEARIVVGARSAVLAPIGNLGVVIVDEEHDAAFKQEEGVRYNGRDVAVMRALQAGCPVVLGSATPSIESWRSARDGRYRHLLLPERVTASPLPNIEVVDLRGRDIVATGGLSSHLATLMQRNFDEDGQTLLFLNRRGYAASLQCYECGEIVECSQCSVAMTLHSAQTQLRCHHCDAARQVPESCPKCDADALVSQGLGTQRLEATVRALLPEARVERLDRDTATRRGRVRDVLDAWRMGGLDVLIGTQMISKGHDAPGVTLVGVVQADLSLSVPDFRAAERTFQLLSQVAGRAGRGTRRGRVIIQTYRPDHFAIAAAVRHDYEAFAARELSERVELGYPPHSRMALLRLEGPDLATVEDAAHSAVRALQRLSDQSPGLLVRGPAPAPIERRKGRYRYQVQLRSSDGRLVRHAVTECRRFLAQAARRRRIRVIVDIDPLDMQ